MSKQEVIKAIRYLLDGMDDMTLLPSEWILIGELLAWHRQHRRVAQR